MLTDVTVAILRYAFLGLIWLFIAGVIFALKKDLGIGVRAGQEPKKQLFKRNTSNVDSNAAKPVSRRKVEPHYLDVIEGPAEGTRVTLQANNYILGRADDVSVPLHDDYCSAQHARIFRQGKQWFVEDLGSTNGTLVDQRRIDGAIELEVNTPVSLGRSIVELRV